MCWQHVHSINLTLTMCTSNCCEVAIVILVSSYWPTVLLEYLAPSYVIKLPYPYTIAVYHSAFESAVTSGTIV